MGPWILSVALGSLVSMCAAEVAATTPPNAESDPQARLQQVNREIAAMQAKLAELSGKERGILGELEKLEAELQLRRKEHQEAEWNLDAVATEIERHDSTLTQLDAAQAQRRRYLAFKLREIYKAGSEQALQRLLGAPGSGLSWTGLGYASYLSERDREVLAEFSAGAELTKQERGELEQARRDLELAEQTLRARREVVERTRRERAAALERIRRDESRHEAALQELMSAAEELGRLAESIPENALEPTANIREFKGLLGWPSEGRLRSGFGTVVHPEFRTEVPHPGWDIEAEFGAQIVSVFDGRVVFADWMRGYGLTAIVDHGEGMLSIYAHASALVVEKGARVSRGQQLGTVGDTGSLNGSFLYFELRDGGEPTDPEAWLLRR